MTGTTSSTNVADPAVDAAGSAPELRTFLFADVRGYTRFTQEHGNEAAARLVTKFVALTRRGVTARGGELVELRGDEAMAIFTSARQALRAAVDLQASYAEATEEDPTLPLPVGIGIDAGEAIPVEGGYRGEALNLASRLCNLAGPGEVLASEGAVYLGRRAQGVSYAERGTVPIKGFADPVRVIRVFRNADLATAPRPAEDIVAVDRRAEEQLPIGGFLGALPSGVLVGRETEWERVMAALEALMQGTGQLVMLSGEPGIGKTRLAQEVTLKARHWGYLVTTGRCYQQEQSVPYYPFLEALLGLVRDSHPTIQAEIPRRWPQLGRLLPEEVGIIPAPVPGIGDGEDQHLLFRAVTDLIETIAVQTPVALILDDLHWADEASLKLLMHLARYTRGYRVLLLGTYRDEELHRLHPAQSALLDLQREGLVVEVEIRRLGLDATAKLVGEIMGTQEEIGDLAELVYRRTDGNAFFIQEMLRSMVERGDLYHVDGRWERRADIDIAVPKSIRSVIGQRLSRLDEAAQDILREASVLGQTFTFDDLLALRTAAPQATVRAGAGSRATAPAEDAVEGALEQAVASGLVREVEAETYAFNHALTQGVLYEELSTRRRKRLHLAAGRVLERLPEHIRARRAGELAWHFLEGDDADPARRYALQAGDYAAGVFANTEAERHYRTALELSRELDDTRGEVESLEKLAGMLSIEGRYDEALRVFEEAAQLYRQLGDRDAEGRVVAQIGQVHYFRDTSKEGIARLQAVIDELRSDPSPSVRGLAALWSSLARLYSDVGRYQEQLEAAECAVDLARSVPDDALLLSAEVARSDALWRLRHDEEAFAAMEELIPRAEAMGDLNNLARALENTAMYYARRGEMEKDREYRLRMLAVAERRGDRGQIVLGNMSLSTNAFLVGQWDVALDYVERAESVIRSLGTTRLSLWPVGARAWLSLRQGDLDAAASCAEQGLALANGPGDLPWQRNLYRVLAERDLLLGKPEDAIERLAPFLDQPGWKRDVGFLCTLALVRLEHGSTDEARELAELAVKRANDQGRQPDLIEALVAQGVVAAREGNVELAESVLQEARDRAADIPLPYGRARALYEYGIVTADRDGARQALQEAMDAFERLGADLDAAAATSALARISPETG